MLVDNLSKSIKPEQQSYMQDAAEISQKINDELININSIFKGSVYKWDQTCKSYFLEKKSAKLMWFQVLFVSAYSVCLLQTLIKRR